MSHLILSRSVDESIVVRCGKHELKITVLEVRRRFKEEVRIGIQAPLCCKIIRSELIPPEDKEQPQKE